MLIALEGIDAAGKNTQSNQLLDFFRSSGLSTTKIEFPQYESMTGRMIRDHLKGVWKAQVDERTVDLVNDNNRGYLSDPSTYLFQCCQLVNRMECIPDELWAWKLGELKDHVFIADRYNASAYAYGDAFGLDLDWLLRTHKHLPQPTLNIFLDISVEESFNRRPERRDKYESNSKILQVVRESYLRIFEKLGSSYVVVDASGTKEETFQKIMQQIWIKCDRNL